MSNTTNEPQPHIQSWLETKLAELQRSHSARLQAAETWASNDDSWEAIGTTLSKPQRMDQSRTEKRIADKIQHDITIVESLLKIVSSRSLTNRSSVAVEEIDDIHRQLNEFNSLDLGKISLTENGVPIEITQEILDDWRMVGMSNSMFVEMRFWANTEDS
jgi:hypothetical protein